MSHLPQLRSALLRAAEQQASQSRQRTDTPSRRSGVQRVSLARHGSIVLVFVVSVLAVAAVALAATGLIGTGAPVRSGRTFNPAVGYGVAIPRTVGLLGIAAPDPVSGPPWTLRVYDTNRGVGCVQIGRLVDGRIGVLGRDGAFHNDGLFHPLPLQTERAVGDCVLLDGHGRIFLSMSTYALQSSAEENACDPPSDVRPPPAGMERCPEKDERNVFYGMLGPQAKSITYELHGHTHTVPTVGPQGAYLIVEKADRRSIASGGDSLPAVVPSGSNPEQPIRKITYGDGQTCTTTANGNRDNSGGRCQPVGYAAEPVRIPAARELYSHVRVRRLFGQRVSGHRGKRENQFVVSFTARVAVRNARSDYYIFIKDPQACRPDGGEGGGGWSLARDVEAGEHIRYTVNVGNSYPGEFNAGCGGVYRGKVLYMLAPTGGPSFFSPQTPLDRQALLGSHLGPDAYLVGNFTYHVPTKPPASGHSVQGG
jgi:hypothetical protein